MMPIRSLERMDLPLPNWVPVSVDDGVLEEDGAPEVDAVSEEEGVSRRRGSVKRRRMGCKDEEEPAKRRGA
jgi:hypothetical protein